MTSIYLMNYPIWKTDYFESSFWLLKQAYKKWTKSHPVEPALPGLNLTHDQLFFINFAQVSSHFRQHLCLLCCIIEASMT